MFIASVAFSETGINCTESLSSEVLPFRTIFKLLSHFSFSMLCKFYNACAECISCSVCAVLSNVAAYSALAFLTATLALYLKNTVTPTYMFTMLSNRVTTSRVQ